MAKLNAIIAIEKGEKTKAQTTVSTLYKTSQKTELFEGFTKVYQKINEDAGDLPTESKRVQWTANDIIRQSLTAWSEILQITARKDWTNTKAIGTVKVNSGTADVPDLVIAKDVPVSYLIYMEKTLVDIRTLFNSLPILNESEEWTFDGNTGLHKTDMIQTQRKERKKSALVLYPATDKHPAQTQIIEDDVLAGYWNNVKQSGAIPRTEKIALVERVNTLIKAVKVAREEANGCSEEKTPDVAQAIFGYILDSKG